MANLSPADILGELVAPVPADLLPKGAKSPRVGSLFRMFCSDWGFRFEFIESKEFGENAELKRHLWKVAGSYTESRSGKQMQGMYRILVKRVSLGKTE